ncbi:hypothetical protein L596_010058 [Steinernema carpocapsae]|uniref:Uncharacterized protein n=1 Tax=Steinernema carpocapsae TaxID=34508 RepID=A0A4U5PHH2_STECR|nr:hypothetical protein L596_010058 [Steinernema carpocapsae]
MSLEALTIASETLRPAAILERSPLSCSRDDRCSTENPAATAREATRMPAVVGGRINRRNKVKLVRQNLIRETDCLRAVLERLDRETLQRARETFL